jgi:hypothetical protein
MKSIDPSRRNILAAAAAAHGAGNSELINLIARHRAARQVFCDAVDVEQEAERTGEGVEAANALWQETNDAEVAAALAMLAYPCQTIDEARVKAEYILASPLKSEISDWGLLEPFLRSFTSAEAGV